MSLGEWVLASAPHPPQSPKCTPTSSPFMGTPSSSPHCCPELKKKKKKYLPISRCERNRLPQGSLALWACVVITGPSPAGSSSCLQPFFPPERRPEAKSPRVGLSGPTEVKMELVKENVKEKAKNERKFCSLTYKLLLQAGHLPARCQCSVLSRLSAPMLTLSANSCFTGIWVTLSLCRGLGRVDITLQPAPCPAQTQSPGAGWSLECTVCVRRVYAWGEGSPQQRRPALCPMGRRQLNPPPGQ